MKARFGGLLWGSGPTDTAVTNYAIRTHLFGVAVAERCNELDPTSEGQTPSHRVSLIVRGYSARIEQRAFKAIVKTGIANDSVIGTKPGSAPRWRLALSPTNHLLACLRSKALAQSDDAEAVKELLPEHARALHHLQEEIDALCNTNGPVARLSQLCRGNISWDAYISEETVSIEQIVGWMRQIIRAAEGIFTTPGGARGELYADMWAKAKIVGVDESACMQKADLCSIWGNTLRPLILAGDDKQLQPTVMEYDNQGSFNNYSNRFGPNGRISALASFLAQGLPCFRMLKQLRMCRGMFDLARDLFYTDYQDMAYGPWSDVSLPQHATGVLFEKFLRGRNLKKAPSLSPEGSLLPVFRKCSPCVHWRAAS